MVLSRGTTGVDELQRLAVLQGALHDEVTSNRVILETLENFSREKIQVKVTVVGSISAKVRATKVYLIGISHWYRIK